MKPLARLLSGLLCATVLGCGDTDDRPQPARVPGIDESFLDRNADPCNDFYRFACGTWIDQHPTDGTPAIQRFWESEARNNYLLKTILDADQKGEPYVPHPDAAVLGNFYGACMTERPLNRRGDGQLDARFQAVAAIATADDLARVLASLHEDGVGAFFSLVAEIDPGNPSRRVATFYPNGLSLPDRDYYLDPTDSLLPELQDHIRALSALYPSPVVIDPAAVVAVETALAQAIVPDSAASDPVASYNLTSVGAVSSIFTHFPLATYLTQAGFPASLGELNVTQPPYPVALDTVMAGTAGATDPLAAIKSYLGWRILEAYAETLGRSFVVEEAQFHLGVFAGDPTPAPDWWACLQSTRSALGFALSQPFVSVLFDDQKRGRAQALVTGVKQALATELGALGWLDSSTREQASLKLSLVLDQVGYPDSWPPSTSASVTRNSYLGNVLALVHAWWQENLANLAQPVDRTTWLMPPCITNAYYDPYRNQMVFPAAILQNPQFDGDFPAAVNYGAIGTIMGHELTHGFDNYGRQLDGYGKLADWWTPAVEAEFVRRANCLVDQYSGYESAPGVRLDGAFTLGENLADLGGVKLALSAYRASGQKEQFTDSFTPDQEFFLAYAQLWCANISAAQLETLALVDPHSPPKFRVNGVVRNLPDFAQAFACAPGSAMAPADRCEVW